MAGTTKRLQIVTEFRIKREVSVQRLATARLGRNEQQHGRRGVDAPARDRPALKAGRFGQDRGPGVVEAGRRALEFRQASPRWRRGSEEGSRVSEDLKKARR